ncbi:gp436 family protein [Serratia liquefaciens]|uniref:gp436 family protein n=1 Tax=Serratia liquefaciens TaxID=614 RepID=UPI003906C4A5
MVYATVEDYIAYFTERDAVSVSARQGSGEVVETRIAYHLKSASGRIDAYIGARYALPLATVPDCLRGYCCDIARYLLTGSEHQVNETIRLRYEDALDWLKLVGTGKVGIGSDVDSGAVVDTAPPGVAFGSDGAAFGDQGGDIWSRRRTGGGAY